MDCIICGKPTERGWHHGGQWGPFKKTCSIECKSIRNKQTSKIRQAAWQKQKERIVRDASIRMKDPNNKAHSEEARLKMIATLKRIGHAPRIRGGNGKEMPVPQRVLLTALGSGWYAEHSVPTRLHGKTKERYPTCYKIDIANPSLKIAIEVDGSSHTNCIVKARDVKKEDFLKSLGWRTMRFSNKEVMQNLEGVLQNIQ